MDLSGQKFGRWYVIKQVKNEKSRDAKFLCKCECGTEREVLGKNLKNGRSKSCGCYKKEIDTAKIIKMNKERALDLTGQKYGLLTPLEPTEKRVSSSIVWKCKCDCGNITYVSVDNLRGQHPVRSCGCMAKKFIGEENIKNILNENNIIYEREYSPEDIKKYSNDKKGKMRFDFYLINENRLIEFDGIQHFKENNFYSDDLETIQLRDQKKNQYAKEHNIPLVRIPYWERDNITLEMIMGDQYLIN